MPQLRTFIDSGVLLAAFKAAGELAENALAVLGDAERRFVSSDFVRLELLPKPICYGNDAERLFYETFFANVEQLVQASALLVEGFKQKRRLRGGVISLARYVGMQPSIRGQVRHRLASDSQTH